ncbi:hypothetical protein [Paraliobacillus sediminis]|uniref:hypothetical protein n=1 Tax=Paraliobacillus sediminis TaxID=1885916 RepID=UPI000E3CCC0D|nr:hypothetical protein [Paraliobacillus sediminis]
MFKKLEAYFKSENDAEAVRAKLNNKVNVRNVMIDQVSDGLANKFVVPLVAGGGGTSATMPGNSPYPIPSSGEGFFKEDEGERKTVLECEVSEEDFNEALVILQENDAHVNKNSFE